MERKILFIRANPVKPDSRVEKEVESLINHGYLVSVLCWDRSEDYPLRTEPLNQTLNMVNAYRVGIKAEFGSGIKNIIKLVKFQKTIRSFLKEHIFDIVHACDFDTAFTAYYSIDHKKTKFVYDIFDFYVDAYKVPAKVKPIIRHIDIKLINKSDITIICTEERKEQISGSNPKNLIVVHNTPKQLNQKQAVSTESSESKNPRICYVGILQPGRLLVELGEIMMEHPDYDLLIGGFGIYEEYFSKISKSHKNVTFYGKIPYDQTLRLEMESDILLAIYDPSVINHKYAAPNKFYESLMLGKPVLMVEGTGMSSVVEQHALGKTIQYSKEGLLEGIKSLVDHKDEWIEIKKRANEVYLEKYSWSIMENRLIEAYSRLYQ